MLLSIEPIQAWSHPSMRCFGLLIQTSWTWRHRNSFSWSNQHSSQHQISFIIIIYLVKRADTSCTLLTMTGTLQFYVHCRKAICRSSSVGFRSAHVLDTSWIIHNQSCSLSCPNRFVQDQQDFCFSALFLIPVHVCIPIVHQLLYVLSLNFMQPIPYQRMQSCSFPVAGSRFKITEKRIL